MQIRNNYSVVIFRQLVSISSDVFAQITSVIDIANTE